MRALARATILTGAASVSNIFMSVIRTKLIAMLLGPLGIGVVAQTSGFLTLANNVVSLGMANAVTKYIAEHRADGNETEIDRIIATARTVVLGFSLLAATVVAACSEPVAALVFGDAQYARFVVIAAFGVPFVVMGSIERAFLQGYRDIKALAVVSALPPALGLPIVIGLVLWLGVDGAVAYVPLLMLLTYLVAMIAFRRYRRGPLFQLWIDRRVLWLLVRFGSTTLLTTSVLALNLLLIRSLIVSQLGLEQNGIYQAVFGMSEQYLAIILLSMSTYSYPRLSELRDPIQIAAEVNEILRLAMMLCTPIIAALIIARPFVISVLYSPEFEPATELMPIQFIGDFFKVAVWSIGLPLLPMARLRAFASLDLAFNALLLAFAASLLPLWGLYGVVTAYAVSYAISATATYLYQRRAIGFRLAPHNIRMLVGSLALVLIAGRLPAGTPVGIGASVALLIAWAILIVGLKQFKLLAKSLLPQREQSTPTPAETSVA